MVTVLLSTFIGLLLGLFGYCIGYTIGARMAAYLPIIEERKGKNKGAIIAPPSINSNYFERKGEGDCEFECNVILVLLINIVNIIFER